MLRSASAFLVVGLTAAAGEPMEPQWKTCAPCHPKEARGHSKTLMSRTLEPGPSAQILQANPDLKFTFGGYSYRIYHDDQGSHYQASDGKAVRAGAIHWAVGQGEAGQTYVVESEGKLYESRVSFYNDIRGLDITIGAGRAAPKDFEEAFGREMPSLSVTECFNCHAGPARNPPPVEKGTLAWTRTLNPGVQCENCHRGAWAHAQARASGDLKSHGLPHLKDSSTEELSDLCGGCHRTWAHVQLNGPHGIANVRFQPYRIIHSKCYDAFDRRIGCTACHDPHNRPAHASTNYDSVCKACHQPGTTAPSTPKVCKASDRECVSCHMPKYELPGSHYKFTDHFVRIVRPNETYPD